MEDLHLLRLRRDVLAPATAPDVALTHAGNARRRRRVRPRVLGIAVVLLSALTLLAWMLRPGVPPRLRLTPPSPAPDSIAGQPSDAPEPPRAPRAGNAGIERALIPPMPAGADGAVYGTRLGSFSTSP
jgi:hypothetical protein